ncbi:hypothetical protein JB92DRAFT_2836609 [Gautieria morchelliformis]|nr:hypothetical protein JB92DRAFT_2836609 [Gautieria morchelliformis]
MLQPQQLGFGLPFGLASSGAFALGNEGGRSFWVTLSLPAWDILGNPSHQVFVEKVIDKSIQILAGAARGDSLEIQTWSSGEQTSRMVVVRWGSKVLVRRPASVNLSSEGFDGSSPPFVLFVYLDNNALDRHALGKGIDGGKQVRQGHAQACLGKGISGALCK